MLKFLPTACPSLVQRGIHSQEQVQHEEVAQQPFSHWASQGRVLAFLWNIKYRLQLIIKEPKHLGICSLPRCLSTTALPVTPYQEHPGSCQNRTANSSSLCPNQPHNHRGSPSPACHPQVPKALCMPNPPRPAAARDRGRVQTTDLVFSHIVEHRQKRSVTTVYWQTSCTFSEKVFPDTYDSSRSFLELVFYRFLHFAPYSDLTDFYEDFNGVRTCVAVTAQNL